MKLNKMMQAVLAAGILSTGSVMANTTTIWTDSSGNPIRDGHDNCVQTGTLAGSTGECTAPAAASASKSSSAAATKAAKETVAAAPAAAYWLDTAGNPVLDGNGQCIRTINWTEDQAIEACDADLVKKEEVKEEVAAKEEKAVAPAAEAKSATPVAPIKSVNLDATASFAVGSSFLSKSAEKEIADFAKEVKELENVESISVEGHTDNTGPAALNEKLAKDRADRVKDALVNNGVEADKITSEGHSFNKPVATNDTAEGRALNRRVEIHVHGAN